MPILLLPTSLQLLLVSPFLPLSFCPLYFNMLLLYPLGSHIILEAYTILPSDVLTLMQHGKPSSFVVGASFLFLLHFSNSLKFGSRLFSMPSHLGTKVPEGLDAELSLDDSHSL